MSGVSTAFWTLVLAGSAVTIALGFAGGRTYARTSLTPHPIVQHDHALPIPDELPARAFTRALHGADSLAAAEDDPDPYGDEDEAVAARPGGAPKPAFDGRQARPRIAIVVVDADREATALPGFASEPFPLTILVPPADLRGALAVAQDGGKATLLDCGDADAATVAAARRAGVGGIACSTADAARAQSLVAANGRGVVLDDRLHDDGLYRAARAAHRPVLSRDITVDARLERGYADFLFTQALATAQRTGVATVAVHARDGSRRALERFAARAERDGAQLVDVQAVAR